MARKCLRKKPLDLIVRLVADFTTPGELVADPFMGSGTTGVACATLGRSFIGIERNPAHFNIACRRIEEAYRQPAYSMSPAHKPVQEALEL